ncbi:hypothetical protein ACFWYW_55720 [Nonomuraea sp. NPDC059023]|uniref:hypothetical protein n=1 Tax=unclassified Nonomuraea TaxID=2593643 RepID=UPI0036AE3218
MDHADAVDAWVAAGEDGDPPAEPEEPTITPCLGDPLFCSKAKSLIKVALADLDYLAAELAALSDGHRGSLPEGRVSGTRGSATPSSIAELLDALYGFLADAEDEWRDTWGFDPRTDRLHRGASPRSRRIAWLSGQLEGMLRREEYVAFGRGVLNWEVVLRAKLKEDPVGTRSPIRCPRPGCSELGRVVRHREGYWQCGACSTILSDATERQQRHDQGVELEAAS